MSANRPFRNNAQVIFVFLLFLGMVMYVNEVKTKKTKNYLR